MDEDAENQDLLCTKVERAGGDEKWIVARLRACALGRDRYGRPAITAPTEDIGREVEEHLGDAIRRAFGPRMRVVWPD